MCWELNFSPLQVQYTHTLSCRAVSPAPHFPFKTPCNVIRMTLLNSVLTINRNQVREGEGGPGACWSHNAEADTHAGSWGAKYQQTDSRFWGSQEVNAKLYACSLLSRTHTSSSGPKQAQSLISSLILLLKSLWRMAKAWRMEVVAQHRRKTKQQRGGLAHALFRP